MMSAADGDPTKLSRAHGGAPVPRAVHCDKVVRSGWSERPDCRCFDRGLSRNRESSQDLADSVCRWDVSIEI
jgi:hypothetical protein